MYNEDPLFIEGVNDVETSYFADDAGDSGNWDRSAARRKAEMVAVEYGESAEAVWSEMKKKGWAAYLDAC